MVLYTPGGRDAGIKLGIKIGLGLDQGGGWDTRIKHGGGGDVVLGHGIAVDVIGVNIRV